jgi:hypothetical protein
MKKIIIAAFLLGLMSCEKEKVNYNRDCNCGTVANDGIDGNCYWLELRNNCSGNKKVFCVDADKWMEAYIGTKFCITNVDSW